MLRFWLQLIPCITCIHAEALQEGLLADDGSIALFRLLSFEQAMSSITDGYSMLGVLVQTSSGSKHCGSNDGSIAYKSASLHQLQNDNLNFK